LENLTSLVNGYLVLLERKRRALLTWGGVGWRVSCGLLRRDNERSLWNQLPRLVHYRRCKPFDINIWEDQ